MRVFDHLGDHRGRMAFDHLGTYGKHYDGDRLSVGRLERHAANRHY